MAKGKKDGKRGKRKAIRVWKKEKESVDGTQT
jgi:hypothetical protein